MNIFLISLYIITAFSILIAAGLTAIALKRYHPEGIQAKFHGSALVILPCRGMDLTLEENIDSLKRQNYHNYKLIAVVDSTDDPSVSVLTSTGVDYIVSDFKCANCSGKVRAISTAISRFRDFDAYVIADSDILANSSWLKNLLGPLAEKNYGVSTTFPYFNPLGGIWTRIKLVWGFVGLGMMESKITRFGWGGSLAFRKDLFHDGDFEFFSEFVSDDIAISKICKKNKMDIAYVPESQPVINSSDDRKTFMEWANRQTALSISSSKSVFVYGMVFYGLTLLLFVWTIIASVFISYFFLILFTPTVANAVKSAGRTRKGKAASALVSVFIPFLYFSNLLIAHHMKRITWRGREYLLQKFQ
ncbi:glycosyltransferase family 2 protein [Oxyplasma meridianum]|uniref:Glycosyltransferase family 2 protein n=1 Tax=Oxyplasma meridianum TaxID=3073602 RepID=A0AAX4NF91_9ARCH